MRINWPGYWTLVQSPSPQNKSARRNEPAGGSLNLWKWRVTVLETARRLLSTMETAKFVT